MIKRIVPNIQTTDPALAQKFYGEILDMELLMDMDWIRTYGTSPTSEETKPDTSPKSFQISFLTEGGMNTPAPDLSIEVDDLDKVLGQMQQAGFKIEHGPTREPWGVRRFFVRDPFGKLVNILVHA
jgi:catechol 2,3-dioxygenase-like lactoylglutathione lyase family enzyme